MTGWVVILTFMLQTSVGVKEATVLCPDWKCVEELRSQEY